MSDASFFGVWDQTGQRWTTPSKLNYDGFPGLSTVQSNVKAGNYDQAKTDLLNYYKNRTTRTIPTDYVSNPAMVPLLMDQIATPLKEYYLNTFTVEHTPKQYTMDLLSTVQGAIGSNLSFMLMGRYKGTNRANIYSREQDCSLTTLAQCRPTLEIQYSDATGAHTANLTSTKDTYIRGNDTVIHARESLLQVQESGAPYDSNTRKAYMNFDLSTIKGTVTAATLKLSGYSELNENTDVMIYKSGDTAWDENTLTYANHNGKTFSWQGLSSGTDWAGPTPNIADIEYHYQITRFYWLDPLIAEYINTGNESYAAKYIDYLIDFIVDGDASTSVSGAGSFPRNFDTGIRAASWVKAYHVLRESSSMNAESNTDLLKTFWKIGDYLNTPGGFSPDGNHGTVETQGLYTLGIYFPEFTDSTTWLSTSYSRFDFLMSTLIYKDGSYMESSDTYTTVTTAPMIAIKQLGAMNNVPFEGAFDNNLNHLGKYLADISFPNGYAATLGDSQYTDLKGTIKQIGDITNDDALRYVGTSGAEGTKPSYTSILYPDSKSAIMRSGWSPNDRYLFTNVKQAAPHRHPDDNAITYYAYGRPLLVDPGAYSYSDDPIANWLRFSTEAHNTIEINDTAQNLSEGWMQDWTDNSKFNFVTGVTQNVPGFKHSRDTLFLKSSFSIVSDVVEAPSGTNKYQQTWHFLPTAKPTLDASTKKVSTVFGDTYGNIQVVPADPEQFTATLDHGYYSNAFYSVSDATYASYTKNVSGNTTFDTVLYPTASGENRNIKVSRIDLSVPTTVASSLKVDNIGDAGTSGYYYVSHEENPQFRRNFDTFSFDGKLAYIEKTSSDTVKSAIMKSGTTLENSGANLIASKMPVSDIAVDWNGTTLEINGSNLIAASDPSAVSAVAVRAPGATAVTLNGKPISNFTVSGDYIYAVGVPSWSSSSGYQNSFDLGAGHSGVQSIEFDLIPAADKSGGMIGYTGQSSVVNSESDLPMIVRLNSDGYFDVRNGSSYGQSAKLEYKANELYHVTLLADLDTRTYNVYISQRGKPDIQIADQFIFNTRSSAISDIGKLVMNSPAGDQLRVINHTVGHADFIQIDVAADAFVNSSSPTTNNGNSKKVELRTPRQAYLRFDLSNIPELENVSFAKLRLTSASTGTFIDQAQFVSDDSWGEMTLTDENKPAGGAVLGVWSMPSAENDVDIDVTSQVNSERAGDKQLSMLIKTQMTDNVPHFYYAKENGSKQARILLYTKKTKSQGQVKSLTIGAEADTMVSASVPTANYGKNTNLEVRNSAFVPRETFVRFNLSGVSSNVTSAKLRLTSSIVGGTFTDKVQFVSDDSWEETTTNYNNKPALGADLGTWEMPPAQQFVDIDVTSQVLAELAGDKKLSLGIASLTANNISHYYYSREKGSLGPQLLIDTVTTSNRVSLISDVNIKSNRTIATKAGTGNNVTLSFTSKEPIQEASVVIPGVEIGAASTDGLHWTAVYTVTKDTPPGQLAFTIQYKDLNGSAGVPVTSTTDGSYVTVLKDPLVSISIDPNNGKVETGDSTKDPTSPNLTSNKTVTTTPGHVAFNFVKNPDVTGDVTVSLDAVTYRQALASDTLGAAVPGNNAKIENGKFTWDNAAPGNYRIQVSQQGKPYSTTEIIEVVVRNDTKVANSYKYVRARYSYVQGVPSNIVLYTDVLGVRNFDSSKAKKLASIDASENSGWSNFIVTNWTPIQADSVSDALNSLVLTWAGAGSKVDWIEFATDELGSNPKRIEVEHFDYHQGSTEPNYFEFGRDGKAGMLSLGYSGTKQYYVYDQVVLTQSDKTAPVTKAETTPPLPDGLGGWYIHPVTVSLSVYDDLSGVADTTYSLDNGATWNLYTTPVTVNQDGVNTILYHSTDKAGNEEVVHTLSLNLDTSVPTATVAYSTTAPTNQDVTATITPSEAVTVTNNGGRASYTFSENGSFTFEFVDAAGNKGSVTANVNTIDKIAGNPVIESPSEAFVSQPIDLNVGVQGVNKAFTTVSTVVYYDPSRIEFATKVNEQGQLTLDESAFTTVQAGLQVIGTGVKPGLGQILLLLARFGQTEAVPGNLITLHGHVKADAPAGAANVSLHDFGIYADGNPVLLTTAEATATIQVKLADKLELQSLVIQAEQVLSNSVIGSEPGQYPLSSKSALEAAIASAVSVRDNTSAGQADVNQAAASLNAAITVFKQSINPSTTPVIPADKQVLSAAIEALQSKVNKAAAGTKVGQYPASAITALKTALGTAVTVKNNVSATQAQVDAAKAALLEAETAFQSELITLVPGQTKVSIRDLSIVAKYYGVKSTDPNWSSIEKADLFGQGEITVRELAAIAQLIIGDWLSE
ncbi:DUF7594 domain-containing protein [Paenibacillus aceris]|uniref:DNRLRE domain-containing protein n=1 Tax=Paenibacillus aceris TaxID=869555 RepID=A0ABS4HX35_9BACL|nr:DNRLRE domain-containing protein [Paenibacillus aceris]MBP1963226.1 hypothetical protein [Paenibacillus aceris]NHW38659.1 DNRLRE domain-containing protein [Paenibacillus aceris]